MKASWTASSARSKSPVTRMSVATARPCSSRNTRSTMSWAASDPVKDDGREGRDRDPCQFPAVAAATGSSAPAIT